VAAAASNDGTLTRLILVNGPPASGKSTIGRRYVHDHDSTALVEVDALRMTLPNWERDEQTRLVARDLAGTAIVGHLDAGRDVLVPQYFGRLGYIVLLDALAREHGAAFVEVILEIDAAVAVERFRARRRSMAEHLERHPERDIADGCVEAFILEAVDRLARLPTARPGSRVVRVGPEASEDEISRRLLSILGQTAGASPPRT
jgi:predicted kinase